MQLRPIDSIDTVACIGAGTIGGGWVAYFLARGYRVRVWDPSPQAWTVHTDLAEALDGAGFVQESAPEDLDLKRRLLADIVAATAEDVVIGSSTSGYGMTEMAELVDDAGAARLVVGHPFNPPYLIPLVEVVGGERTAPEAADWAARWYDAIGKSVIRMDREVPGFIANRLQEALWREAL